MAWHPVVTGFVGGAIWGVVLRLWMRFISTRPGFTWSGTLAIISIAAFAGLILGVLWWRRDAGGSPWWRLLGLGVLPVFSGAGVIMLPSVLLGAVGIGRTGWNRRIRMGLVVAGFGVPYLFLGPGSGEIPAGRLMPALAWFSVMLGIEMWAVSVVFRPWASAERHREVDVMA